MANQVILFGHLGQDPELRYTQGGKAVTAISVATTEIFYDRDGNKNESTEWHRVILWEKQAEVAAKFLTKGSKVYIQGKITYRSYEQDGAKKYVTEIVAKSMEFGGGAQVRSSPQPQQARPQTQTNPSQSQPSQANNNLDSAPF